MANELLLQAWLMSDSVVENMPSSTMEFNVSTLGGVVCAAFNRSRITVIIIPLATKGS